MLRGNLKLLPFRQFNGDSVNTYVDLREKIKPELWGPNTGKRSIANEVSYVTIKGLVYSRFKLVLSSVKSIFIVGKN
ncbi:MAG TPA: hypothetical protein DCO83_08660 [Mucilaginibacter sp.]|jgi:glutamate formiminotransferase|nr:hypothetical protein [Mucilaginibacter sp.]